MNSDLEERERGLLPYSVITKAVQGDPEAMMAVVRHYEIHIPPFHAKAAGRVRRLLLRHRHGHPGPPAGQTHAGYPGLSCVVCSVQREMRLTMRRISGPMTCVFRTSLEPFAPRS